MDTYYPLGTFNWKWNHPHWQHTSKIEGESISIGFQPLYLTSVTDSMPIYIILEEIERQTGHLPYCLENIPKLERRI